MPKPDVAVEQVGQHSRRAIWASICVGLIPADRARSICAWHIPTSSTWKITARSTPRERARVMTEVSMTIRATESRGRAGSVIGVIPWRASTAANLADRDSDVRRSSLWED